MSNVDHPSHYNATKFEVWDVLDAWFPTNPTLWNVGKYLARADRKGGLEDLKKAKVYLEREIEKREGNKTEDEGAPQRCGDCGHSLTFQNARSIMGECPMCKKLYPKM